MAFVDCEPAVIDTRLEVVDQAVRSLQPSVRDGRFAAAMKGRPVVLGYYFNSEDRAVRVNALPKPVLPKGAFKGANAEFHEWKGYTGNLPAYVVIYDHRGGPFSGPTNWHAGFLPASYQGTVFRSVGDPILDLSAPPQHMTVEEERKRLDHLAWMNQNHSEKHAGVSDLSARIASYELAYRMQGCAPEAVDISQESEETKRLYGLDNKVSEPFGRQCLLARRFAEAGVRYIEICHSNWDQHGNHRRRHNGSHDHHE